MAHEPRQTHKITVGGTIKCHETKAPVASAEVRVGVTDNSGGMLGFAMVATDAKGHYRTTVQWEGPPVARLGVDVRGTGHAACYWPWHVIEREDMTATTGQVQAGESHTIDIEPRPGFSVDVLVEDPAGNPVPGVASTVFYASAEGGYCFAPLTYFVYGPEGRTPHSDERGYLRWQGFNNDSLPGARFVIALEHEKYAEYLIQSPETLPREENLARLTVRLQEGVALHGSVTNQAGKPIEGARVRAVLADKTGEVPRCHEIAKSARSGADGRYTIRGLAPGNYTVHATHAAWRETVIDEVALPLEGHTLDVQLAPGATVSDTVLDATGAPVAGADIMAFWSKPHWGRMTAQTDEQGKFSLQGLPTRHGYRVEAHAADRQQAYGYASLRGSRQDLVFDARQHATVAGGLLDPATGQPAPHAVTCTAWTAGEAHYIAFCQGDIKDGAFSLAVPPGDTVLFVKVDGQLFGEIKTLLQPGEQRLGVQLSATPAVAATIRVLDASTSCPLPEAAVDISMRERGRTHLLTKTGANGEAVARRLSPAWGKIKVICPGYRTAQVGPYRFGSRRARMITVRLEPEQSHP